MHGGLHHLSQPLLEDINRGGCGHVFWELIPQDGGGGDEGSLQYLDTGLRLAELDGACASCFRSYRLPLGMILCWDGYLAVYHLVEGGKTTLVSSLFQRVASEILEDGRYAVGGTTSERTVCYKAGSLPLYYLYPIYWCSLVRGPYY